MSEKYFFATPHGRCYNRGHAAIPCNHVGRHRAGGARREIGPNFDGKTFNGWEGNLKYFRIEQGAVVAGNLKTKIPNNEFLCTKKTYKNFILKLEVKLVGGPKANAGIQIRTKRIPNHHEVIGYQADMGQGWWGALYDESRRRRMLAQPKAGVIDKILKPNDWNQYEIRCEGPRIRLYINGTQTIDFTGGSKIR